jgi:hypothetical protein
MLQSYIEHFEKFFARANVHAKKRGGLRGIYALHVVIIATWMFSVLHGYVAIHFLFLKNIVPVARCGVRLHIFADH